MARPSKNKTESLVIRIPANIKKELKIEAAVNDTTMSQIMLDAYANYKKNGKK